MIDFYCKARECGFNDCSGRCNAVCAANEDCNNPDFIEARFELDYGSCKSAYDAGYADGLASQTIAANWTPCAEGLPEAFEGEPKDAPWYMCTKQSGARSVMTYLKCGNVSDWRTITGLGISETVVAWFIIPQPWTGEKKGEQNNG